MAQAWKSLNWDFVYESYYTSLKYNLLYLRAQTYCLHMYSSVEPLKCRRQTVLSSESKDTSKTDF